MTNARQSLDLPGIRIFGLLSLLHRFAPEPTLAISNAIQQRACALLPPSEPLTKAIVKHPPHADSSRAIGFFAYSNAKLINP